MSLNTVPRKATTVGLPALVAGKTRMITACVPVSDRIVN